MIEDIIPEADGRFKFLGFGFGGAVHSYLRHGAPMGAIEHGIHFASRTAILLVEERDTCRRALCAYAPSPTRVHRTEVRTGFPADDDPLNVLQVVVIDPSVVFGIAVEINRSE